MKVRNLNRKLVFNKTTISNLGIDAMNFIRAGAESNPNTGCYSDAGGCDPTLPVKCGTRQRQCSDLETQYMNTC